MLRHLWTYPLKRVSDRVAVAPGGAVTLASTFGFMAAQAIHGVAPNGSRAFVRPAGEDAPLGVGYSGARCACPVEGGAPRVDVCEPTGEVAFSVGVPPLEGGVLERTMYYARPIGGLLVNGGKTCIGAFDRTAHGALGWCDEGRPVGYAGTVGRAKQMVGTDDGATVAVTTGVMSTGRYGTSWSKEMLHIYGAGGAKRHEEPVGANALGLQLSPSGERLAFVEGLGIGVAILTLKRGDGSTIKRARMETGMAPLRFQTDGKLWALTSALTLRRSAVSLRLLNDAFETVREWPVPEVYSDSAIAARADRFAFAGKDGVLRVRDAEGQVIGSAPFKGKAQALAISPDGRFLALAVKRKGVMGFEVAE